MNNELEIRILTGDVLGTTEQTQEAITMAVRALSQPDVHDTNVGDLISRAEALDEMQKAGTRDGAEWAVRILPPAQPEPRWIPVDGKERLPKEGQRVLVTDEDGEIDIAHIIDYSDIGEGIEWWAHDYKCYPIAWSELPKPYERSEE